MFSRILSYELALCKVVAERVHDARVRFQQKFPQLAAVQQQQQYRTGLSPRLPPPSESEDHYLNRQTTITRSGGLAPPPPPPPPPALPVSVDALRLQLRASRATMSKLTAAVRLGLDRDLEVDLNSKQQE